MATVQSVETPANEISTQSRLPAGGVEELYLEQIPDSSVWEQDAIAQLAYELWQARGCPEGSPEADWLQAEQHLQLLSLSAHVSNRSEG